MDQSPPAIILRPFDFQPQDAATAHMMAHDSKRLATSHQYTIRELHGADIDKAYALIQAAYAHATPADWQKYARHHTVAPDTVLPGKGIVIVENAQGYIAGLFAYRVRRRSLGGPNLECDHFILPEVLRADRLFKALLDEAEDLAHRLGCRRLLVALPNTVWRSPVSSGQISLALKHLGFRPDRFVIRKDLGTGQAKPV